MVVEANTEHLVCASTRSWGTPRRRCLEALTNICLSDWSADSGTKSKTACGMVLACSMGLFLCNSSNVVAFLGANGAPVSSCLALDTCPLSTRDRTAAPLREWSSSSVLTAAGKWCAFSRAFKRRSPHPPCANSSALFGSSSRPTDPVCAGLLNTKMGTKQKKCPGPVGPDHVSLQLCSIKFP